MNQIPNLPNCMPVAQPNYNAVKIDVINPMVNVPAQGGAPVAQQNAPQYATPTMPIYNYPQAQNQPYYMPPNITTPEMAQQPTPVVVPPVVNQAPEEAPAPTAPAAVQAQPVQPAPEELPPAPVVTEEAAKAAETKPAEDVAKKSEAQPVEVVEPTPVAPQIDLNDFITKLTNPDYEIQAAAMENIASMVKDDPQKATELLDSRIVEALTNIITADTSAVPGATPEQEAARQKLFNNQPISEEEKAIATKIAPKELAERNKSYAIYTAAIMQKLFGEEVQKLTNSTVPLTELPGAVTVVEQLKNNPNPIVRTSAIEALSYIQNPSYKKDLETLFTIAQQDQNTEVQDAAKAALEKLNKMEEEQPKVAAANLAVSKAPEQVQAAA